MQVLLIYFRYSAFLFTLVKLVSLFGSSKQEIEEEEEKEGEEERPLCMPIQAGVKMDFTVAIYFEQTQLSTSVRGRQKAL